MRGRVLPLPVRDPVSAWATVPAVRPGTGEPAPLLLRQAGNRALADVLGQGRIGPGVCRFEPRSAAETPPPRGAPRANAGALQALLRSGPGHLPPRETAAGGRADPPSRRLGHEGGTVRVFEGPASRRAAARLGSYAYTWDGDVFLGEGVGRPGGPSRDEVLRHELHHVSQSRRSGPAAAPGALEAEAHSGGSRLAADPDQPLGFWWVLPVAAAAYVLLRPNVANAPSPEDVAAGRLRPSVSPLQVGAEAFTLFAVPAGVAGGLARMGYGVISSFALSGAASAVSYRGVQDVGAGQFSGVEAYVVDATTGAVIGVVVGGTFRAFAGPSALGPRSQPGQLVHLTDEAGQAGIQSSGVLRGSQGIYAVPEAAAAHGTVGRTARTLLAPAQTTHVVSVPQAAGGAFVRPVPLGPLSAYQYFMGVHRAAAGSISTSTGAFTAGSARFLPNITGQFFPYGVDGLLWIAAASASPAVEGAETRGLPGLGVPGLPYPMRDALYAGGSQPVSTRVDGPFIVLPPPMLGLEDPQAVAAVAAQPQYDPIGEVCLPPLGTAGESGQSLAGGSGMPAIILVAPVEGAGPLQGFGG